jgi:Brp/Blh family beta-carotene 15,15'-monooxygenase
MGVSSLDAATRRTLRPALAVGWVAVALATLPALLGVELSATLRYAPLVASVLVVGLPHGAIDIVALPRTVSGRVTPRWLAVVGALYLVPGAAYALAWFAWPAAAAVAFVALTWLHWGQGDLYALVELVDADHLGTPARNAATLAVRGGLPMLVPLLGHPETYAAVVETFARPFGGRVDVLAILTPDVRLALGVAFAAVTVLTLAITRRGTTDRGAWRLDAGETLLLWAFFLVTPPVFAIGVYFCLWHSVRHVARAATVDSGSRDALAAGELGRPLWRFARDAAPLTVAALALLAGLWVVVPNRPATLAGATGFYLAFVAMLTLPHVAVVFWMDAAQGIWRRGGRPD